MENIVLILIMAIVVEALVEYGKTIGKAFTAGEAKTAVTQIMAIVVAVMLCLVANANLFSALGINLGYEWVGVVLTGIFASRGSNYVSDLVKRIQGSKQQ